MTNAELISDFTRIRVVRGCTILQIAIVTWPSPSEPRLGWRKFRSWSGQPQPADIAAAQAEALRDHRYFLRCERCRERCNVGHMHDDKVCQGCAEQFLHVAY